MPLVVVLHHPDSCQGCPHPPQGSRHTGDHHRALRSLGCACPCLPVGEVTPTGSICPQLTHQELRLLGSGCQGQPAVQRPTLREIPPPHACLPGAAATTPTSTALQTSNWGPSTSGEWKDPADRRPEPNTHFQPQGDSDLGKDRWRDIRAVKRNGAASWPPRSPRPQIKSRDHPSRCGNTSATEQGPLLPPDRAAQCPRGTWAHLCQP